MQKNTQPLSMHALNIKKRKKPQEDETNDEETHRHEQAFNSHGSSLSSDTESHAKSSNMASYSPTSSSFVDADMINDDEEKDKANILNDNEEQHLSTSKKKRLKTKEQREALFEFYSHCSKPSKEAYGKIAEELQLSVEEVTRFKRYALARNKVVLIYLALILNQ